MRRGTRSPAKPHPSRRINSTRKKNYTTKQPFTKRVKQILNSSRRNESMDDSCDDDNLVKTKRRKIDENGLVLNNSGGSSSSVASAVSTSSSSTDEEVSTSEDAVYGEKFEPKIDLLKLMLRENLRRKEQGRRREVKEVLEMEVDNKDEKRLNLVNDEEKLGGGVGKSNENGNSRNKPMFKDLGGMRGVIKDLIKNVIVPHYHPEVHRKIGGKPVCGILFHGPPGCGKTKLAHAIANETRFPFYKISATELVSGVTGASEEKIRELFSKAHRTAPSIVFIDEIDAIASKRENLQREMERRIVTQLLNCMDESHVDESADGSSRPGYVLVIGATNRPDAIDAALRRPGRFDREFALGVPDEKERVEILSVLTSKLKVEGAFDLLKIARSTPGFVGADLAAVVNMAANFPSKRIMDKREVEFSKEVEDMECDQDWWKPKLSDEEMEKLVTTVVDFEEAVQMVQPSSKREGFSTIPNVKWDDVGGLEFLKKQFDRYLIRHIKFPEVYEEFRVNLETGFLLYGPPGCGKTLIAMAVANEAGASFIHIKGPELMNKYVGESEAAIRTIFARARICSPCVVFFDEVDVMATKRGQEGGWVVERPLTQLLIELSGAGQRQGVYVIGATNRPEVMDEAILRPGRFGKLLYVPLPTPEERGHILKALSRKMPIDSNVDLMAIAKDSACENLSGADLSALMNEAAMAAIDDELKSPHRSCEGMTRTIKGEHFTRAFEEISPSVSEKQIQHYKLLSKRFKSERKQREV